jgi:hypothetical protein
MEQLFNRYRVTLLTVFVKHSSHYLCSNENYSFQLPSLYKRRPIFASKTAFHEMFFFTSFPCSWNNLLVRWPVPIFDCCFSWLKDVFPFGLKRSASYTIRAPCGCPCHTPIVPCTFMFVSQKNLQLITDAFVLYFAKITRIYMDPIKSVSAMWRPQNGNAAENEPARHQLGRSHHGYLAAHTYPALATAQQTPKRKCSPCRMQYN